MKKNHDPVSTQKDVEMIRRVIELADESIKNGGGPFGAAITMEGRIISEGSNSVVIMHDPTAHAEINAIRKASEILGTHALSGCTLYSSCEPCPMCLGAVYWAGIGRVVYSSGRKDAARAGFDDDFIYREISLNPANRSVVFHQIVDPEAAKVFRRWEELDNKIPY
ncbi:MAG: nucleoside deaminase [Bacteroidales bacterium]|jgi:guanine deaminase